MPTKMFSNILESTLKDTLSRRTTSHHFNSKHVSYSTMFKSYSLKKQKTVYCQSANCVINHCNQTFNPKSRNHGKDPSIR